MNTPTTEPAKKPSLLDTSIATAKSALISAAKGLNDVDRVDYLQGIADLLQALAKNTQIPEWPTAGGDPKKQALISALSIARHSVYIYTPAEPGDRQAYYAALAAVLTTATQPKSPPPEQAAVKPAAKTSSQADEALSNYDHFAKVWIQTLPHDDREIVLLAIMARAQQSLDHMGRLPAALSTSSF